MSLSFSPARAHIDLNAIKRNFQRFGSADRILPVVKADAYGHGLLKTSQALLAVGARRFAVGTVAEGLALREAGVKLRIVVLLPPISRDEWRAAQGAGLTPVVCSFKDIVRAKACATKDHPIDVTLALETGMHRLGFTQDQLPQLISELKSSPEIVPVFAMSHLATADMPEEETYMQRQVDTFAAMGKTLKDAFPTPRLSLQNSAAALTMKNAPFELIRPGIALYGGNPFYGTDKADLGRDFEWAMSLSAPVLQVAELKKNETCSYGRTFRAAKDMHIAVVAAGYANGLPRRMSNKLSAIVNGKPARQIGRVCMGLLMLDVTERASVKAGDDAWLMGGHCSQGFAPVTPQVLADIIGTISYEVLCRIGGLNERVYD